MATIKPINRKLRQIKNMSLLYDSRVDVNICMHMINECVDKINEIIEVLNKSEIKQITEKSVNETPPNVTKQKEETK